MIQSEEIYTTEEKLGQEPAFSRAAFANEYGISHPEDGMSKWFYAACAAMQGVFSARSQYLMGNNDLPIPSEVARYASDCANELLKIENINNK